MLSELFLRSVRLSVPIEKDSYLNDVLAVRHLSQNEIIFSKNVTFLVGENGSGKSTLIEAIATAYGFNPEGGSKNFRFSTNNSHSELWKHLTLSKGFNRARDGFFLRAESLYNAASYIDEIDKAPSFVPPVIEGYGGVSLHKQSHGESFLALVQNRFFGNGLYILDEPEAALSPTRLMTLISEMQRLLKTGSQFIIATHSPILMCFPDAEILNITQDGIKSVDYKETEHYNVTRRFLENPDKMLKYILDK